MEKEKPSPKTAAAEVTQGEKKQPERSKTVIVDASEVNMIMRFSPAAQRRMAAHDFHALPTWRMMGPRR